MKLYEITGELRAQLERMANEDQSPEEAAQCLRELSGEFKDKINAVVSFALELQATAKARTDAAKRMADGAKAIAAKAESLLDYAQISIENVAHPMPMRLPNFTINLAKMNNLVEQDHRAIKRRTRPMLGFKDFHCAVKIIAGIEIMHMIRKGQWAGPEGQVMSAAELFYSLAY